MQSSQHGPEYEKDVSKMLRNPCHEAMRPFSEYKGEWGDCGGDVGLK